MKNKIVLLIVLELATVNLYSQPLDDIVDYFRKTIKEQNLTFSQYLGFTKPYAKWDIRPLNAKFIIGNNKDTIGAKQIPNMIWGAIGHGSFQLDIETLQRVPNEFIMEGFYNKERYLKEFFPESKAMLVEVVEAIKKSKSNIFVQQSTLPHHGYERVDNIFREGKEYWRYKIANDSPFQISPEVEMLSGDQYSSQDEFILEKLKVVHCYCVAKIDDQILFMAGGLLDNSIGFIYSQRKPTQDGLGYLFDLSLIESTGDNFYFYVSR